MLNEDQSAIRLGRGKIAGTIVGFACFLALFAFGILAIQSARETARRMQSSNNLKQIALSVLNYESANRCLPLGGDTDALGPKHGWCTRIHAYLEASTYYSEIDMDLAWDHPRNNYLTRQQVPSFRNPSFEHVSSQNGFALTHYLGSPGVFRINEALKLEDAAHAGAANSWLAAECFADWYPRGYPYNWRELTELKIGAKQSEGLQLATLDAAVHSLDLNTDSILLEALQRNASLSTLQGESAPQASFGSSKETLETKSLARQDVPFWKGGMWNSVFFDERGIEETLVCGVREIDLVARSVGKLRVELLREHVQDYPQLRNIILFSSLTPDALAPISALKKLERLHVRGSKLEAESYALISELPTLLEIYGLSDEDADRLRVERPELSLIGIKQSDQP